MRRSYAREGLSCVVHTPLALYLVLAFSGERGTSERCMGLLHALALEPCMHCCVASEALQGLAVQPAILRLPWTDALRLPKSRRD